MYSYPPTQLFTIHPHEQQQLHQAIYVQQQQQGNVNLLYHPYEQLQSIQTVYSNPTHASVTYAQQPIDQQQQQLYHPNQSLTQIPTPPLQQQMYHSDQVVPQPMQQIPTPPQHQQIQRSSPVKIIKMQPPDARFTGNPISHKQEILRPIPHTVSRTTVEVALHSNRTNSISSKPSTSALSTPYESIEFPHHYHSRGRDRLYSGSSCYESESPDISSDDEEQFEWRPTNVKLPLTKTKSKSTGRLEQVSNDIYQKPHNNNSTSRPKFIQYIEENIIGKDYIFKGPWGIRRLIYCDHTASGRPLIFIENYIKNYVLPLYGNTHSEASFCAQQSTKFREEARNIIKKSVNANENDVLLFTGTGATGAVHTLVSRFDLHDEKIRKNTVIIIGAFEHHSNILPWQETGVDIVRIPTTNHGLLDKSFLKEKLDVYSKLKKRIICSLSAASNLTGIFTNVDSISTLVHSYSSLIFWDYATAAPYVKIDMNPSATAYKDGIFISTHKFLGGPSSPGILIAKRNLFNLSAPKTCGGGTVNFVTRTCREYNFNIETREEGGTPDIIGCIRAGLVFQLKDSIDLNYIQTRDDELVKRFHERFKKYETLILLGSQTVARLPIFSFAVYIPGVCKYLHQNLVCRLFTDLFGIQVRSGCACAGPYALDLLNVNDAKMDIYSMFLTEDSCLRGDDKIVRTMMMKPGFTRLNLPYFSTDEEIEYIFNAVEFIALHGWKFLPFYTYNPTTAAWSHRNGVQLAQISLQDITYKSNRMQYYGKRIGSLSKQGEKNLPDAIREAKILATDASRHALETIDYTSDPPLHIPDKYKHMIWFALPIDIALMMIKQKETKEDVHCDVNSIPFIPDDAKAKIINSLKTKTSTHGLETSTSRKKRNTNRSSSTARVR